MPTPTSSHAHTVLKEPRPGQFQPDPAPIRAAWAAVDAFATPMAPAKPMYSSAVGVMGHRGHIVSRHRVGHSLQYADGQGTLLPEVERIEARQDTIYDLASVTKLFTAILVMQLVEQGRVDLDEPYARYIPEFGNRGKDAITVSHMLTHTSGLEFWLPLWSQHPDAASRIKAVMDSTPRASPGTVHTYSDLNLISLGLLVERLMEAPLDILLQQQIASPLGLGDTGYTPAADKQNRIAATEFQRVPQRAMVWGEVQDENAWSLGGVAGHAGIFSTADDLAVLAQTLLNGGAYANAHILKPESVSAMMTDKGHALPGNGLGFELNRPRYMSRLASQHTVGHTGYCGTSIVIDFRPASFVVLLTNRVHPSRHWGSVDPARRAVADGLAAAIAEIPTASTSPRPG